MWALFIFLVIKAALNKAIHYNKFVYPAFLVFCLAASFSFTLPIRDTSEVLPLSTAKVVEINGVKYCNPHDTHLRDEFPLEIRESFLVFEKVPQNPKGVVKKNKYSLFGNKLSTEYCFLY